MSDYPDDPQRLIMDHCSHMPVPTWVSDTYAFLKDQQTYCKLCRIKFTSTGRYTRHHCRLCGEMVCRSCSNKFFIPEKYEKKLKSGASRVCHKCFFGCMLKKIKKSSDDDTIKRIQLFVLPAGELDETKAASLPKLIFPPKNWASELSSASCYKCNQRPKIRHHCRACGELFCEECSSKVDGVPDFFDKKNKQGPKRVCDYCRYRITSIGGWRFSDRPLKTINVKPLNQCCVTVCPQLKDGYSNAFCGVHGRMMNSSASSSMSGVEITLRIRKEGDNEGSEPIARCSVASGADLGIVAEEVRKCGSPLVTSDFCFIIDGNVCDRSQWANYTAYSVAPDLFIRPIFFTQTPAISSISTDRERATPMPKEVSQRDLLLQQQKARNNTNNNLATTPSALSPAVSPRATPFPPPSSSTPAPLSFSSQPPSLMFTPSATPPPLPQSASSSNLYNSYNNDTVNTRSSSSSIDSSSSSSDSYANNPANYAPTDLSFVDQSSNSGSSSPLYSSGKLSSAPLAGLAAVLSGRLSNLSVQSDVGDDEIAAKIPQNTRNPAGSVAVPPPPSTTPPPLPTTIDNYNDNDYNNDYNNNNNNNNNYYNNNNYNGTTGSPPSMARRIPMGGVSSAFASRTNAAPVNTFQNNSSRASIASPPRFTSTISPFNTPTRPISYSVASPPPLPNSFANTPTRSTSKSFSGSPPPLPASQSSNITFGSLPSSASRLAQPAAFDSTQTESVQYGEIRMAPSMVPSGAPSRTTVQLKRFGNMKY